MNPGWNTVRVGGFDQDFVDDDSRYFFVRVCVPELRYTYSHDFLFPARSLSSFGSLYHMRPPMMDGCIQVISTPAHRG